MRFAIRCSAKSTAWFLAALCIVLLGWMLLNRQPSPVLSKIVARYPIGENGMVYAVLTDAGGATSPFIYRYFLHQRLDDDQLALKAMARDGKAFLVTRDAHANVSVAEGRVNVSVKEQVYRFHSPAALVADGQDTLVDVWLDARIETQSAEVTR
ncbi:hypothetical protein [Pseudomonas sp. UBA1879]|uniref:hypothetical protein n=1 Tax=Pseudomonas sp. UBA1879 TaxID=1947305 RepID=UPI0025EE5044|nr:hypothetical protein [Pseudomonas sp. UBA1879]